MIRVERLCLGATPQDNMLELPLLTSMYLGDRWSTCSVPGDDFAIRAYGSSLRNTEHCHLTFRSTICGFSASVSRNVCGGRR